MVDDSNGGEEPTPSSSDGGKLPHPFYNWMSLSGAAFVAIGLTAMLFFLVIGAIGAEDSGYSGLTLLPPLLMALVASGFVVGGWVREARRQRRGQHSSFFETVVVDPWTFVRGVGPGLLFLGLALGTAALLAAGAGSMALVEATESNEFCTGACHSVMGPEAVAYEDTAHSRIPCVECHVGSGADAYLEAKLGGLRQLYSLVTNEVSRPIPTPIHGGTISRELCERCHAPERDRGYQTLSRTYYLSGEDVMPVRLAMVLKVGGTSNGLIHGEGIHYHMQVARQVEYVARDPQRQDIAWIRVTREDGSTWEFDHASDPLDEEERASLEPRAMQCIDCHSRPAHRFQSPIDSMNAALAGGVLSRDLPSIKEVGVQALDGGYEGTPEALAAIEEHLRTFYEEEFPEVLEDRSAELDANVAAIQAIYQRTIFPEMKADWTAHPNNLGHRDSAGCFRCHNDEMVDAEGETISTECSGCHSILAQEDESIETVGEFDSGLGFLHPEDFDTIEDFTLCSDCHTGGQALYE